VPIAYKMNGEPFPNEDIVVWLENELWLILEGVLLNKTFSSVYTLLQGVGK